MAEFSWQGLGGNVDGILNALGLGGEPTSPEATPPTTAARTLPLGVILVGLVVLFILVKK